jgi:hypothetical protein
MIIMRKYCLFAIPLLINLTSCEEVIHVDLNNANPEFVVEATIFKDSVSLVHLTRTTSYFSNEEPDLIEDAIIMISEGTSLERLNYMGNGYYIGKNIIGIEDKVYKIEITHDGITYEGSSYMPIKPNILSVSFSKNNSQSIFNPNGETILTINCEFIDEPGKDNYYMIRYFLDGKVLKDSYYLVTEYNAINGTLENSNSNHADSDTLRFSESMFYEGIEAEVQIFSIDETVYNYFVQLNDVLYWKRRFMPPTPYNPVSNINNGVLGYFAAWAYDSKTIMLK